MTGNFAFGTGCWGTTRVERGWYSRIFGCGNSGSRPSAGRGRTWPGGSCCATDNAEQEDANRDERRDGSVSWKCPQRADKPNSVPLRRSLARATEGDDHSSSSTITGEIEQPTRKLRRAVRSGFRRALPYLVLLRAGFCLPPVLPPARCALTAPFHPYPPSRSMHQASSAREGGIFSVPLSFRLP